MSNHDYIEEMVLSNDSIIFDTSAIMDTVQFSTFLKIASPIFRSAGKQITIPRSVRAELIRHLDSPDEGKREKAQQATNILAEYSDLFFVPGGIIDDNEVAKAFADAELLGLMIVNRRRHRQLLIANDRNLTSDAFNLNQQQSCQGSKISVCHINRFGELQCCDCVTEIHHKAEHTEVQEKPSPEQSAPTSSPIQNGDVSEKEDDTHVTSAGSARSKWKWPLTFGGGVALGYATGKYGKTLCDLIKSALYF